MRLPIGVNADLRIPFAYVRYAAGSVTVELDANLALAREEARRLGLAFPRDLSGVIPAE